MFLKPDERLEDLCLGSMKVIQSKNGYRFSLDAVLLAYFAPLQQAKQVIDLGTGNGVLPLILAYRKAALKITGLDIQKNMLERAQRTIEYNKLEETIDFIYGDVKKITGLLPSESVDLVVCNPPFWRKGEGKLNDNLEVSVARHEIWAELNDFIRAAAHVLKPKGKLAMIHRTDRLTEIFTVMSSQNMPAEKIRMIHTSLGDDSKLVLVQGCKNKTNKSLTVKSPLIVYDKPGQYSSEIKSYYGE